MSSLPQPSTFRPDELPIVNDLARRLGRPPTEAEAREAISSVDQRERAAFALFLRRAGIH